MRSSRRGRFARAFVRSASGASAAARRHGLGEHVTAPNRRVELVRQRRRFHRSWRRRGPPDRRVGRKRRTAALDARGLGICLAVERGPIVYFLEECDAPAGVDLADVVIESAARPVDGGSVAQLGDLPAVALTGVVRELDGWRHAGYRGLDELPETGSASPVRLLAVPYFAWANRDEGGMRVWIPATT